MLFLTILNYAIKMLIAERFACEDGSTSVGNNLKRYNAEKSKQERAPHLHFLHQIE